MHIAGQAGIWLIAMFGFAGLALHNDGLSLAPQLPAAWQSLTFRIEWRRRHIRIRIVRASGSLEATLEAGESMTLAVSGREFELNRANTLRVSTGSKVHVPRGVQQND